MPCNQHPAARYGHAVGDLHIVIVAGDEQRARAGVVQLEVVYRCVRAEADHFAVCVQRKRRIAADADKTDTLQIIGRGEPGADGLHADDTYLGVRTGAQTRDGSLNIADGVIRCARAVNSAGI